eukprot:CAMPEP_0167755658 /NCGR_PEP_ID=MMETSP0110_2-20121227/8951_1 /TAXON_ID=629695 /ORGANISM="Gymnochlora sp., Strain CCMP2014" /LENGTH=282 /DNA_ID=CAMNT_0007641679 /DNA_START=45 /DNA_END=893 /DNA_ORIENTATION=-
MNYRAFSTNTEDLKIVELGETTADKIDVHEWSPLSQRTGVIGMKLGMMQLWDDWNEVRVVTVVKVDTVVTKIREKLTTKGMAQIQVAGFDRSVSSTSGPILGEFKKMGMSPKRKLTEFQVTPDAILPVGFKIDVRHFFPGQFVDIQGKTKGKGTAGVMKRWGFAGQAATHGVSKTHRHLGSTGQCQGPGKVFKGKKMPGRMGNKKRTAECLQIFKIDVEKSLLFILGAIPGANGGILKIRDARKRPFSPENPPPFPTFVATEGEEIPDDLVMPLSEKDPFDD